MSSQPDSAHIIGITKGSLVREGTNGLLDKIANCSPAELKELAPLLANPEIKRRLFLEASGITSASKDVRTVRTRSTTMPYYKEQFGREMIFFLDKIISSGKSLEFRFASFPKLAKQTLFNRVSQSILYVEDMLDDEVGTYRRLVASITVRRLPHAVRLELVGDSIDIKLVDSPAEDGAEFGMIRSRIQDFIDTATDGHKLEFPDEEIKQFLLTDEQKLELQGILENFMSLGIYGVIKNDNIMVVKAKIQ